MLNPRIEKGHQILSETIFSQPSGARIKFVMDSCGRCHLGKRLSAWGDKLPVRILEEIGDYGTVDASALSTTFLVKPSD